MAVRSSARARGASSDQPLGMVELDGEYPGYGFAEHKGYSTLAHTTALTALGPSDQHRYSFINVRRVAGHVRRA